MGGRRDEGGLSGSSAVVPMIPSERVSSDGVSMDTEGVGWVTETVCL